jgi:hypothetical protein
MSVNALNHLHVDVFPKQLLPHSLQSLQSDIEQSPGHATSQLRDDVKDNWELLFMTSRRSFNFIGSSIELNSEKNNDVMTQLCGARGIRINLKCYQKILLTFSTDPNRNADWLFSYHFYDIWFLGSHFLAHTPGRQHNTCPTPLAPVCMCNMAYCYMVSTVSLPGTFSLHFVPISSPFGLARIYHWTRNPLYS